MLNPKSAVPSSASDAGSGTEMSENCLSRIDTPTTAPVPGKTSKSSSWLSIVVSAKLTVAVGAVWLTANVTPLLNVSTSVKSVPGRTPETSRDASVIGAVAGAVTVKPRIASRFVVPVFDQPPLKTIPGPALVPAPMGVTPTVDAGALKPPGL